MFKAIYLEQSADKKTTASVRELDDRALPNGFKKPTGVQLSWLDNKAASYNIYHVTTKLAVTTIVAPANVAGSSVLPTKLIATTDVLRFYQVQGICP